MDERIRKNGGAMTLNLSNPEDYEYALKRFGGPDVLAKYEQISSLFEKTKAAHERGQGTDYKTLLQRKNEEADKLVDAVYIAYAHFDEQTRLLSYCCVVSLTEIVSVIDIHINVCNNEDHQIDRYYQTYKEKGYAVIKREVTVKTQQEIYDHEFYIKMDAAIIKQTANRMDTVIAQKTFYTGQVLSKVEVAHPVQQFSDKDTINVFYGRLPQRYDEKVDYVYDEAFLPLTKQVNVMLDMMGTAEFSGTACHFTKAAADECDVIMDMLQGAIYYKNKAQMLVEGSENGFSWYFNKEWKEKLGSSNFTYRNRTYLTMMLRYQTQETKDHMNTLTLSSFLADQKKQLSTDNQAVRVLNLMVGCLAKGVPVTMADGSRKNVENIRIGDKVRMDSEGGTADIENIWTGTENEMVVIETENGDEAVVSRLHPVETENGLVKAEDINMGMRVMTEQGLCQIRFLYGVEYGSVVYNLQLAVLDGMGRHFAGGILVGDAYAEEKSSLDKALANKVSSADDGLYREFVQLDAELLAAD